MSDDRHGWLRRLIPGAALLAGALLTLTVGCSSGQTTASIGMPSPATGSARPAAPSATGPGSKGAAPSVPTSHVLSAAAGTITVSLPVVTCPTTVAVAATPIAAPLPSSRPVAVPSAVATGLAVYADTRGTMALVGPKGWKCAAAYGADGSGGVLIYPPGVPAPQSANAVWKLGQQTARGIYGTESSACYTCTLGQACPLFPAAAKAFRDYLGHGCGTRPAAETVTPISGGIVSFEDPPGVHGDGAPSGGPYPANAVMTYYPNAPDGSWQETCTLPDSEKAGCTAALNTFIAWYGSK